MPRGIPNKVLHTPSTPLPMLGVRIADITKPLTINSKVQIAFNVLDPSTNLESIEVSQFNAHELYLWAKSKRMVGNATTTTRRYGRKAKVTTMPAKATGTG